jgi:hypothetical protein
MIKDSKKFDIRPQVIARMNRRFGTLCCLVLMISSGVAEQDRLSVQETLGGIFIGGPHATAVAKAANPAAKPILYQLLDKPQMKDHRGRIYLLFRYIGDKEDAAIMEKRLKAGHVDWGEIDKVLSTLATMASMGVYEAGAILERMTKPEYWRNTKFAAMTNSPIGMTNELAIWGIFAYARSGKGDWQMKVKSFKDGLSRDTKVRGELEWRLHPTNITQHIQETRAFKVPPISPELRELLPQLFNGDMENPGPATEIKIPRHPAEAQDERSPEVKVVKILAPKELALLKLEAINAFTIILDAFLNERYEQLALTIARGGKPLVPIAANDQTLIPHALEQLKRISTEGGFAYTKAIIKDLNPRATSHGEPTGEILSDGTTVIRIPCLGSEPVAHKHVPGSDSTLTPTIDQDGQLNIYMLKQGGHWYWNPFGW